MKADPSGPPSCRFCRLKTTFLPFPGFNPAWNENFQFDVYVPDLALVRFVVEDYDATSDNEFVGQYTLPLNSLKMGESPRRHNRRSVLELHRGLRRNRGCFSSAQRPHPFLHRSALCAPTQDTGTCLCSTRTGAFCPRPASSCTPWSWTPSETPPTPVSVLPAFNRIF